MTCTCGRSTPRSEARKLKKEDLDMTQIAILYVEFTEFTPSAVEQLETLSLGNCKQLVYAIGPNEIIIRLECNDTESVNRAIIDFAGIEGVALITTCVVKKS
jgi:hypothetical protein